MRKPGRARMPVATALRRLKTMQRYNVPQREGTTTSNHHAAAAALPSSATAIARR
jgi:hypothetical protein